MLTQNNINSLALPLLLLISMPLQAANGDNERESSLNAKECQNLMANEEQYSQERQKLQENKQAVQDPDVPEEIRQDLFGPEDRERLNELNRLFESCQ